jgi:hypothetical protein
LPFLTVPFNIVQQTLFLTVISVTSLNTRDALPVVTHHVTSQPQPLVPASLISVEMLRHFPDAVTEPQLLDWTALEDPSARGILDSEDAFQDSPTTSKSTRQPVTEYDRKANVLFSTVRGLQSALRATRAGSDFEQKAPSVSTLTPHRRAA